MVAETRTRLQTIFHASLATLSPSQRLDLENASDQLIAEMGEIFMSRPGPIVDVETSEEGE